MDEEVYYLCIELEVELLRMIFINHLNQSKVPVALIVTYSFDDRFLKMVVYT